MTSDEDNQTNSLSSDVLCECSRKLLNNSLARIEKDLNNLVSQFNAANVRNFITKMEVEKGIFSQSGF